MRLNFFQQIIDRRVDARINEILNSEDSFEFQDVSDSEAREKMKSFILKKKEEGITQLGTLDFVLSLRLPAQQVESILDEFETSKKIKEVE